MGKRTEILRDILSQQRNLELARGRQLRLDQDQDALSNVGDELDVARTQSDNELQASLLERASERVRQIDGALQRLDNGHYGQCEQCGDEIPLERLKLLPFAINCVDCQRGFELAAVRGGVQPQLAGNFSGAGADDDAPKAASAAVADDDDMPSQFSAFGPDSDELESMAPSEGVRRRGRPRKNKEAPAAGKHAA